MDRTTGGKGKVADLTLAETRQLDAGSWFDPPFAGEKVPTFEEVLQLVAVRRRSGRCGRRGSRGRGGARL
ncbi:glycerophosphodiester phosphodiesterase family protein [Candidatus Laterigemmans baculatus]|uniref:glycerophosphodiester phosphodiesterase family protein n=1 Tax=Candidatus Laterigemmans baculatus TaxID=2770505 RepID=UPI0028F429C7|nr:glycerophosphodiester phosphodiesterase family protein [Candidatus Laterigemmans baculatus]